MTKLPNSRGPISAAVISALRDDDPSALQGLAAFRGPDALTDDDLELALWVCYELHYRGFDDVSDAWEWSPDLIAARRPLEDALLEDLRRTVTVAAAAGEAVPTRLWALVDADDGPSLSRFLQKHGNLDQYREFAIHRSIYQLKEADPHTWAVPRLAGRTKAALVEIQVDEYGAGVPARMHSELYRQLLCGLDLDDGYGAYVDVAPGISFAISNVMTLFGLRRELRGALVGHLAAYEMTSSAPCRRYAKGLRRLGMDDETCAFHDVHVVADSLHEQLAAHDLCGSLARDEPALTEDILWGAAVCLHVEGRFAEHLLASWNAGRSSLSGALQSVAC